MRNKSEIHASDTSPPCICGHRKIDSIRISGSTPRCSLRCSSCGFTTPTYDSFIKAWVAWRSLMEKKVTTISLPT